MILLGLDHLDWQMNVWKGKGPLPYKNLNLLLPESFEKGLFDGGRL